MSTLQQQLEIEKVAHNNSYNKFINEISKRIQTGNAHELPEGKVLIKAVIDKVTDKIEDFYEAPLKGNNKKSRMFIEEYRSRPQDLAFLTISVLISKLSLKGSMSIALIAREIVSTIYDDLTAISINKQKPTLGAYLEKTYKTKGKKYIHSKKIRIGKLQKLLDCKREVVTPEVLSLGSILISLVSISGCNLITVFNDKKGNKTLRSVKFSEEAFSIILNSREVLSVLYKKYPIFVLPPKDYKGYKDSLGYYDTELYKGSFIKCNKANMKIIEGVLTHKNCDRYLNVLNTVSKTPYRINQKIYDVMTEVINNNIMDYDYPKDNPHLIGQLPYFLKQEVEEYINVNNYGELEVEGKLQGLPKDKKLMVKYFRDLEKAQDRINTNNSKAISYQLALTDAKDYYNEPNIYFSYQADFRGRIYPVQQHLNPQGNSNIKALLEFSTGYPIETDYELEWFKIHGANCYGKDKVSYADRVAFIDSIEEEIKEIASDPLRYRSWKDTDSPYLFLAWCFEYVEYLNNPKTFKSRCAIALDATCSGIQIYSGLLLDYEGAKAVNVVGENREDIYQVVADLVNSYLIKGEYDEEISYTTSDGLTHNISTIALADSLKGKVTRSMVKRNVMTQPYSVTYYGMYQQMIDELNSMENSGDKFWIGDNWLAAKLITSLNDRAIKEVVKGAKIGQEFLKSITSDVCKNNSYIFYMTPFMQFPVLQKIHKVNKRLVRTELGRLSIITPTNQINETKMLSGIAPNFVHSIDATLMFMTVEKMMSKCKDFHLIHDSYGVPIKYVKLLNESVREAYIELFQTLPLKRFVKQVCPNRENEVDEILINDLDLTQVETANYIYS